jgi:hypothetical protein
MRYITAFGIGLLVFIVAVAPSHAAISFSRGFGGIDFEGTGTITHMQQPPLFEEYGVTNCTPHFDFDFTRRCNQAVDTTLLGNDIVRAEHVRITSFSGPGFSVRFGCSTCGVPVTVGFFDTIQSSGGRLSAAKEAELQSMLDLFGAKVVRIAVSLSGTDVSISSSVRAVGLDLKPGGAENSFNPRSRGMIGIAILTTPTFDASLIDETSLRFGVTGHEATAHHAVLEDVDNDGDMDLLVFFRSQTTNIDCDTLFTYLSGETSTGQAIAGTDSVAIVGCRR